MTFRGQPFEHANAPATGMISTAHWSDVTKRISFPVAKRMPITMVASSSRPPIKFEPMI